MPELITVSTSSGAGKGTYIPVCTRFEYDEIRVVDVPVTLSFDEVINLSTSLTDIFKINTSNDVSTGLDNSGNLDPIDNSTNERGRLLREQDSSLNLLTNSFDKLNQSTNTDHRGLLPYVDVDYNFNFRSVNVTFTRPKRAGDPTYLPTTDFKVTNELMGFTTDFIKPIDYDKVKTDLSPVDSPSNLPWERSSVVDVDKVINYGYSNNKFIIGGGTGAPYPIDPDAVEPPEPEPEPDEVINIVNIINVVVLPSRTPINFTNLNMAYDLDSISWVVNFDIHDLVSLGLLKPVGLSVKEVEVNINGELFNFFIGRTNSGLATDDKGKVTRNIRCTGWSNTKLLTYPYSLKGSHRESSSATPAGILSSQLTGSGFTGVWSSPLWTLPAGTFSYKDKTPLAAISEIVSAIGSVIIPHPVDKSFEVKPYYPVSPWNWSTTTPDREVYESQFFSIDTEWMPQSAPDSIYVYGEEDGVGVKCVRQGTAGTKTLPTIVDKHITDTVAGQERGRIEVAKAGFKEQVPVSTYLDGNGLIMPQELLKVNEVDGVSFWFGMVISNSITIKRQGNAVIQQLIIERHYE